MSECQSFESVVIALRENKKKCKRVTWMIASSILLMPLGLLVACCSGNPASHGWMVGALYSILFQIISIVYGIINLRFGSKLLLQACRMCDSMEPKQALECLERLKEFC